MNWLRGNQPDEGKESGEGQQDSPSSTPDANELRRRRLAKLEEAQAAEKAKRDEFEERKAKWAAEKKAKEEANPPPPPPPPKPEPKPQPEPVVEPQPKRAAQTPLPPEELVSIAIAKSLGIALTAPKASQGIIHLPDLIEQLRADSNLTSGQKLLLSEDQHADDILLNRINSHNDPLGYLFECYRRCGQQFSEVHSNRRMIGDEHKERRTKILEALAGVERRVMMYSGMLLGGAFMDVESVTPAAFAVRIMNDAVPGGFIKALLNRHVQEDEIDENEMHPMFSSIFRAIRDRALDMKLSSRDFLKPLKALTVLLSHKELCKLLVSEPSFLPEFPSGSTIQAKLQAFAMVSYLYPFFSISALPGVPLHQPRRYPEDPSIATSMFPNPSTLDRREAEGAIYSLRSPLSVARSYLHQICLSLCKAGPDARNAMLNWFGYICNINKKRTGMSPNPKETSRDGLVLNVLHVVLKLCDPIVSGGWKMLQKVDPSYPQSSHRVDYEDETRLAADTDMLKRWWVDKRNENAQDSLARQMEVVQREADDLRDRSGASREAEASSSDGRQHADLSKKPRVVATDFSFVTECFWLALRLTQLGFVSVMNTYDETILRTLHRMKEIIRDMEGAKETGALPRDQEMQLSIFKSRYDSMLQAKLCYDVYLHDHEFLASLVRFVTADAEWLMKKLLSNPARDSLLPLPVPVDPTFASLPEHTVETITTVLLTTMRIEPRIIDDHSALLDNVVSFCIAGSASPLHVKNPYLRAKLIEFLWTIFPRGASDDDEEDSHGMENAAMESLFAGHELSRKFLPGSLFRLYVDVEHTGSHTQFYDKFSIRYRIGSILESLWHIPDYRKSVRNEARDEVRFLRFVNMVLNDANHLLDSALDDLEEIHTLQTLINGNSAEWQGLSDEEKTEKKDRLQKLEGSAKGYNQLGNSNVKLIWLLTDDKIVRRIFLRDEMVSRVAEMLNYLLVRLCGQRCNDLVVSEPEKVSWKPRQLLTRIMGTYIHFHSDKTFASAVARDGRSYKPDLFTRAIAIAKRRRLMSIPDIQKLQDIANAAAQALEAENAEEENLGDIPDEFLDPIMSSLMRNPVRLPTSGNVMDRAVISRILLSDKVDPFNRKFLSEDMLEEDTDLKKRIDEFIQGRKTASKNA